MQESTARIGDGRTDGRTLTTGLEVNAFRAVGRKSKTLAETCDFEGQVNIEIRDQFIFTCRSTTLKKKLLQQENLTLEKLLEIGRNKELSQKQATEISNTKSSDTTEEEYVNKFNQPRSHSNKQRQTRQSFDRNPEYKTCFKCGGEFTTDHQRSCIAIGKSCYNCGKLNHLSKVCRTKRTDKTVKDRHIRNINDKSDSTVQKTTMS